MAGSKKHQAQRLTLVAEKTTLKGKTLVLDHSLRVEGHVKANVQTSADVFVGEAGHIIGNIDGRDVTVFGRVDGHIVCTGLLTIARKAYISGTTTAARVSIADEASVDVHVRTYEAQPSGIAPWEDPTLMRHFSADRKS